VHNVSWFGAFVTLMANAGAAVIATAASLTSVPGLRRGLARSDCAPQARYGRRHDAESCELDAIGYPRARISKVTTALPRYPSPAPSRPSSVARSTSRSSSAGKGLLDLLHAANLNDRASRPVKLRSSARFRRQIAGMASAQPQGIGRVFPDMTAESPAELAGADLFVLSYFEGTQRRA
jgi:hypothetical protein